MHTGALDKLGESFKGKRLSDITKFSIQTYMKKRGEETKIRANRELATLKSLFNRCVEWGKFDGANPCVGVKLFREPKGRLRFLEEDEEAALLAAASEPLRTLILVGIHCGLRLRSEALTLKWGSIDLKRRQLTVEDAFAKNHERRTIPLNSIVFDALSELRKRAKKTAPEDPVFADWKGPQKGEQLKSIRTAFDTAKRKANLGTEVTPHTLRHTFARRLVMAGVDLRTVQELGGWKELDMVVRYTHLSPSHKADAVEKLTVPSSKVKDIRSDSEAASQGAR